MEHYLSAQRKKQTLSKEWIEGMAVDLVVVLITCITAA
jgi:hypothetical protein